ncbi:MAG TPA: di-heme oxidoredictase family protein [Kofleriaceae bacterium]|nr:di-heme oxidoredictase family protein [Kofleriaceae bacterium]
MNRGWFALWISALVSVIACGDNLPGEDRQGGDTTVDDRTRLAFRQPAANATEADRARYQAGRSPFDFVWEVPKLGPLFNNSACLGCHGGNGRGMSQIGGMEPTSQALVRVSLNEGEPGDPGGPIPVPGFGTQLQDHATVGLAEVRVTLTWIDSQVMYDDGELVDMREPRVDIRTPMGDLLPANTRFSYRIAPPLIGLGLLEAIPEADLRALADPDDADGDGISGKLNEVWDPVQQATVVGRFGWKANTSRLAIQVPGAFVNDMGLTSYVFPEVDGNRDVNDEQLDDTVFFASIVGVPVAAPRDAAASRGRDLFDDFGCASCHVPTHTTGPHPIGLVGRQRIHPYTDLLLHDVGDRLTDARPDFLAEGVEWRTPALWGIGLTQTVLPTATFMHDGRARTLPEAILWHGGEAMSAREAFRTASRADRDALIAFLRTL